MELKSVKHIIQNFVIFNNVYFEPEYDDTDKKITEILRKKINEKITFNIYDSKQLIVYGRETDEIRKINEKIHLVYKKINQQSETEEINGILLLEGNRLYEIFCDYKKLMKEKETVNHTRNYIFDFYIYKLDDEDLDYYDYGYNIEEVKELLGNDVYKIFNEHFLREDKLNVKNAIYKIF